ncbi:ribosomal protein S6 kinase alpha-2-like [Babylonia areolata]|uniref:ribosomal protein S6 kinase alpha-2-like n=1 Tax=Babylonia areolata TaxID=304850 RepID=UPI003FD446E7
MAHVEDQAQRQNGNFISWISPFAHSNELARLSCLRAADDEDLLPVDSSLVSPPQMTFSSFEPLKHLGKGAFGKVLLVRKKDGVDIEALYAMKIIKKAFVIAKSHGSSVVRERDIMTIVEHPFVIELRYSFQTEGKVYLAMPFMAGGDFYSLLHRHHVLPEGAARFYAAEMVLALEFLHSKEVVYRDLKPENTLIDREDSRLPSSVIQLCAAQLSGSDFEARDSDDQQPELSPEEQDLFKGFEYIHPTLQVMEDSREAG